MINLFDQDTTIGIYPNKYQDNLNISDAMFFGGFDPDELEKAAAGANAIPHTSWRTSSRPAGRQMLLQMRFTF